MNAIEWFGVDCISIAEPAKIADDFKISIFPNPSNGNFSIEISNNNTGNIAIEIINVQGLLVYSKNISNVSRYSGNIDISSFSKGFYFQ